MKINVSYFISIAFLSILGCNQTGNNSSSSENDISYSKSNFIELLGLVEQQYNADEKLFLIDISTENLVLFQLVHRKLKEKYEDDAFGYCIHFAFDQSFQSSTEELNKFKQIGLDTLADYSEWDGIPTYQIDMRNNKEKIADIVEKTFSEVYGFDSSSIFISVYEM